MTRPPRTPRRPRLVYRLALRTSALTAAITAATAMALLVVLPGPWWLPALLAGLAAGLASYAAVQFLTARRLLLAHDTLRKVRKRDFEMLARLQIDRRRDELDEMIWQVYRAGRLMQEEIERLEHLENYRREFLANISHELKTPIFVISGFAEQLLDGALEDPRVNRRFVDKIGRNAQRLGFLARDLLAISRIESGEMRMHQGPFAVKSLVNEVIDVLESVAESRAVKLLNNVPDGLPRVIGDREQLRQVLTNLVDNAIKYNREGGHVEVSARVRPGDGGSEVRIAVADDGLGIPAEALPRITERFYRVDRSRSRQQGGTGLGLAIVKHVLEAHGQTLRVDSRPGSGSSFSFSLPVAPDGDRHQAPLNAPA
jgi:two-component system, OmpR family, phosphate regulon sensor histidine kinase PhoR